MNEPADTILAILGWLGIIAAGALIKMIFYNKK